MYILRSLKNAEQDVSHIHFNRAYRRRKMMRHAMVSVYTPGEFCSQTSALIANEGTQLRNTSI